MGYYSIGFSDFPDISCFPGVLGLFVCVCVCVVGGGAGARPASKMLGSFSRSVVKS